MFPDPDGTYLLSLEVENIRCFKDKQKLDLSDGKGSPAQWTVLLGENGTGKTTLLWSILLCIPWMDPETLFAWLPTQLMAPQGTLKGSWRGKGRTEDVEYAFRPGGGIVRNGPNWGVWLFGYGASRKMAPSSLTRQAGPTSTLSSPNSELTNAEEWLLRLHYDALLAPNGPAARRVQQALDTLVRLLPDVDRIELPTTPNGGSLSGRVKFHTPYGPVPLLGLSLGYQTMIGWTVDLAARLFEAYPDREDPLSGPAVVLVDEIDLHIHPAWQRHLLQFLSARFPSAQFIVTAHSPLVVQAAADANLVVLRRDGDRVVIDNDPTSVRGWRVDQILTSELFGLDSARPVREAELLRERTALLSQRELGEPEQRRLAQIERELGALPTAETPEDREAMDLIRRAAAALRERGHT
jgi:hypothetical protein